MSSGRAISQKDIDSILAQEGFEPIVEMVQLFRRERIVKNVTTGAGDKKKTRMVVVQDKISDNNAIKILAELANYQHAKKRAVDVNPFEGISALVKGLMDISELTTDELQTIMEGNFTDQDVQDLIEFEDYIVEGEKKA